MKTNRIIVIVSIVLVLLCFVTDKFITHERNKDNNDVNTSNVSVKNDSSEVFQIEKFEDGRYKPFYEDIDNDGKDEKITYSYGITSGIYTFILEATKENSNIFYYNVFAPDEYDDDFVMMDGRPVYCVTDTNGAKKYFDIKVRDRNIVLESKDDEIRLWGSDNNPILQKAFISGKLDSHFFDVESRWGVAIKADDVTSEGLTLIMSQLDEYGDGRKTPKDEIITGEYYTLEVLNKDKWEPLPVKGDASFIDIAYIVPRENEFRMKVDWKNLYGELKNSYEAGLYRMSKDFYLSGNKKTVYTYFAVYDDWKEKPYEQ